MPVVTPNFTGSSVQPGLHPCIIEGSELKESKTGNLYIKWKLKVESTGQQIGHNTPIEGRGAGMFKHFVHSAGDASYEAGPYDTDRLKGKRITCDLQHENFQGQQLLKVKDVKAPSVMDAAVPTDQDIPF